MRRLRRLLVALLLLVLALCAGLALTVDGFARRALEQQLAKAFTTKVVLEQVEVDLLGGTVEVTGLSVANAPGFGELPLFAAQRFEVTVRLASLFSTPLVIESAILQSPRLRISWAQDGSANLEQARRPPQDTTDAGPNRSEPFRLRIERLEVADLELHFEDGSTEGEPVAAHLEQLDVRLFGVDLFSDADRPVSDLRIGGRLAAGEARAPLQICAFAPPIPADGLSDFDLELYAAGIDLQPFETYLTAAATELLGGRYLDVGLRCQAQDKQLQGLLLLRSSGGEQYELALDGTIRAPRLADNVGVLAAFRLPGQKLGRLLGLVTGAASDLREAAVARAGDLAEEAGKRTDRLRQAGRKVASGVSGIKDAVMHPTQAPQKAIDAARGLGRGGVRLVEGVLGAGKNVAEKAVDLAGGGAGQALESGENLAATLLSLSQILHRAETGEARTRRQAEEQQRFLAAVRQMLERRRRAAQTIADETTAQRVEQELRALDVASDR